MRLNATASSVTDMFSATPMMPFADFEVPPESVAASFGSSSVTATASHHSTIGVGRMTAEGEASASGNSTGSDPGSAQASSSFFVGFRLMSPQHMVASVTLTKGVTANAQFVFQRSDGSISYFLNADAPQPIAIAQRLPAGDYTVVGFASASVALFPGASLADSCGYTIDLTLTCPADFNGDGFTDFFDYDDFVTAYEEGC